MNKATIEVYFYASYDIRDAFIESLRLANMWDIRVKFKFNEIECFGVPKGNLAKGLNEYFAALKTRNNPVPDYTAFT